MEQSNLSKNSLWRKADQYLSILRPEDKKKLVAVVLIQSLLGFLDLLGVAVIGVVGALAVSGISTGTHGERINSVLQLTHLDELTFQNQIAVLGLCAAILLIIRTMLSISTNRRVLVYLGKQSAQISTELIAKLFSQNISKINSRTLPVTIFSVTDGVNAIVLGILSSAVSFLADFSLLVILGIGLFIVNPIVAILTLLFFVSIGALLYRLLQVRAKMLGMKITQAAIDTNATIIEGISSYREALVKNRRNYYINKLEEIRLELGQSSAEMAFMPNISKYTVESAMVIGTLLISASQFLLSNASHAIGTLSIFLAAGTRIAPAILRMQQSATSIKSNSGIASPTLQMIEELKDVEVLRGQAPKFESDHRDFVGKLTIEDMTFRYTDSSKDTLSNLNLEITQGAFLAIVGPSGAGKTTLIDLILGASSPNHGKIEIFGSSPLDVYKEYPGAVAYVPQDVAMIDGSIRENVSLGYPRGEVPDELIINALRTAHLWEVIESFPDGLSHNVGERGLKLSGGQRQRLGIARALLTKPKFIVLDEATSALDAETEKKIADSLLALKGECTLIVVAHRLSTVREADFVAYIDKGKLLGIGSFEEIRRKIPDFDMQAKLMGL